MPTLMSDQRFHHAFHPYQSTPQTSRSSLPCFVHSSPITNSLISSHSKTVRPDALLLARCVEGKQYGNFSHHTASPAASSLIPTCNGLTASSAVPTNLPNSVSASISSASPAAICASGSSMPPLLTKGFSRAMPNGSSPVQAFLATQGRTKTSESSRSPNTTTSSPLSPASNSTQYHRDFVRYLKAWRPPVEYYARRRYQHPSLSYPSRSPSLPSLLEERITNDGNMDTVCPEQAKSPSPRAYRRRIFPAHLSYTNPVSQHRSTQGWDDDSEEDLDSDDDDEDIESDGESDSEAVTPTSSPGSSPTYFLQPLVLTKLPGY
ncbi:hypothetical protein PTTG_00576 [Puccinia triticina 1-1 BBBD Race 1]|uniref:Uncharacterized protein n=1 Tax=Puccinia triticina (isolate 1-1 / race 1 (BBBD)) TaxID=630390 RepID=A0A180H3M8_PUCT1|nr:hypothetical protein PTTG_00576 [Puccinia triticina 1-1 BBBD Race 1]